MSTSRLSSPFLSRARIRAGSLIAATGVLFGASLAVSTVPVSANTTPGTSADGAPPEFLPAPNATAYCDSAVYFSAIDEVQAIFANSSADIEPLIDQNNDGDFNNDTGNQSVVEFTASAAGGSPSLVGTRTSVGATNGAPTPAILPAALDIGLVMNTGAEVDVVLSEPLFYSQWIFTDVDGGAEGFDVTPTWAGTPGEIAVFGGHPNNTASGTGTSVSFNQTGGARSGGGEVLTGRVQTDLLGPVTGLSLIKTGSDNSAGAGFTVGGGCEALGVAKTATTPTWNSSTEVYEVTYTIRVTNNLPTTAELTTLVGNAQSTADFDFLTGSPTGIPVSDISLDDPLTLTGFSGATVTSLTSTGTLTPNGSYDGTSDSELIAAGQSLAPGDTETFTLAVSYAPEPSTRCNGTSISNQAFGTGLAAGASVSDQSDDGTNPSPTSTNGSGTSDDVTPLTFAIAEACDTAVDLATPPAVTAANAAAYPVSGTCAQDGDEISITINSTDVTPTPTPTCSTGTFSFDVDALSVPEGTGVDIVATVADDLGFTSSSSDTETVDVNTLPVSVTQTAPGDITAANAATYPVSGTCAEDGDTVTVSVDDGVNPAVTGTDTCAGGAYSVTLDVSGLDDGPITVTSAMDDGINPPASDSDSQTKDTVTPAVTLNAPTDVSAANATAYPVSGTCSADGDTVTVSVDDGANTPVTGTDTCAGGTYSVSLDVSGLDDGPIDVSASIDDGVNPPSTVGPVAANKDVLVASVAQTAPGDITAANATAYPVSGTCAEDGDTVTVTADDGVNTPATGTDTCSGGTYSVTLDVSGLDDGPITVTSAMDDGINPPVTDTDNQTKDTLAPAVTQTAPGDISATNATSYPVSGTCSEDGDTVTVSVDDGVNPAVTGTDTCSSGTYAVTLNVAGLDDGPITVTSAMDDGINPAVTDTDNQTKDTSAPAITQTAPGPISAANASTYPVSGTCSADGDTVTVSVDDGVNPAVTGTDTCAGGTYSVSLNVAGLDDGPITVTSAMDDGINPPVTDTDNQTKDTLAPAVTQTAPGDITAANATAYAVSGTCSEDGDTVTVTADDLVNTPATGTDTCTGGTYAVTLDVAGLNDGPVQVESSMDDGINPAVTDSDIESKDTVAPAVTLNAPADVSAGNATTYPVSGTCTADGDTVTVSVDDGVNTPVTGTDTCAGGTYAVSLNVAGLDDGPIDVTASIDDGINPVATAGPVTATKDAVAPTITQTAPGPISAANASTYPVSGVCSANGDAVTVSVDDGVNAPATAAGTCASGVYSIPVDASGLNDGPVQVSSTITDTSNPPVTDGPAATTKDTSAPTVTLNALSNITGANDGTYPVSGTCSADGDSVVIEAAAGAAMVTDSVACSGGTYSTTLDVSGLADGSVTITASIDDGVNPPASTSGSVTKDTTPPTVTQTAPVPVSAANAGTYPVAGTCSEDGDTITVTVDDGVNAPVTGTDTCASGVFSIPVDASGLDDGPIQVSSTITDGVHAPVTDGPAATTKDTVNPTVTLNPPADVSAGNVATYPVSGTCTEDGDTVTVTVDDGVNPAVTATDTCAGGTYSVTLDVSGLDDGPIDVTASIDDGINPPATAGPVTATKDAVAPTITQTSPGPITAANATAYPVSGTCSANGDTVTVTVDDGVNAPATAAGTCASGVYSIPVDASGLDDGPVQVSSTITDTSNPPVTDGPAATTKDTVNPTVTLNPPADVSAGNVTAYPVSGTCTEDGDTVTVTVDDGVNTPVTGTDTCAGGTYSVTLDVSDLDDGPIDVTASIDDGINPPATAGPTTATKDAVAPTITQTSPGPITAANATAYPVSGVCSANGDAITVTVDDGVNAPATAAGTCASGVYSIPVDASGLDDGPVQVSSTITDTSNPPVTDGPAATTKDTVNPTVTLNPPADVSAGNVTTYPISGTCSEDGDTVTLSVDDGVNTPVIATDTCAGGTYSVTLDVSGLDDGPIDVSASIDDGINPPATAGPTSATKDAVAPTITQTAPGAITAANASTYPVSGVCSANGDAITVTVDDGVNAPATAAGTCSSGTYTIPVNASGLDDGPVQVSSSIVDTSNPPVTDGPAATTKDTVNPTVTLNPPADVSAGNVTTYPISGTCSEDGDLVTVGVSAGASTVTDSVACSGGTYSTTLDLSGLPDGPIDVSASIDDGINPPATAGPTTATKDAVAPTITQTTPGNITAANASTYPVSGVCSANGDAITVTVDDGVNAPATAAGTCSGGTYSIPVDASGLDDGPVQVSSSIVDTSNPPVTDGPAATTKDTVNPTVTLNPPADVVVANVGAYPISGTCSEDGDTVTVSVDDGVNTPVTATETCAGGTYSTTLDLSSLSDGPIDVTASIDDGINPPATAGPTTATKDADAPTITQTTPGPVSAANAGTYPVSGICSGNGDIVTVTVDDGVNPAATGTGACSGGTYTIPVDASGLNDGPVQVSSSIVDTSNPPVTDGPAATVKDTVPPTVTPNAPVGVTEENVTSYPVSGSCTAPGDEITIDVTDGTSTVSSSAICDSSGNYMGTLDVTDLDEGPVDVSVSVDDGVNTPATSTVSVQKDADPCVGTGSVTCFVIEGRVFLDSDRGGDLDGTESDIGGVEVQLIDSSGTVVATTTTTASGPYRFENVQAGDYVVRVVSSSVPTGLGQTYESDGSLTEDVAVTVVDGDVSGRDFGYALSQISGVLLDAAGRPLANQPITVTDSAGSTFTTTTDANGRYAVEGTLEDPLVAGPATVAATVGGSTITTAVVVPTGGAVEASLQQSGGGGLAQTGSSTWMLVGWGTLALLLGAFFVLVARRRRDDDTVPAG